MAEKEYQPAEADRDNHINKLTPKYHMPPEGDRKATGFTDYPQAIECQAVENNAPAPTARRPRPIMCIADGCLCSFASDEDFEAGIPRDKLPIGCAAL